MFVCFLIFIFIFIFSLQETTDNFKVTPLSSALPHFHLPPLFQFVAQSSATKMHWLYITVFQFSAGTILLCSGSNEYFNRVFSVFVFCNIFFSSWNFFPFLWLFLPCLLALYDFLLFHRGHIFLLPTKEVKYLFNVLSWSLE